MSRTRMPLTLMGGALLVAGLILVVVAKDARFVALSLAGFVVVLAAAPSVRRDVSVGDQAGRRGPESPRAEGESETSEPVVRVEGHEPVPRRVRRVRALLSSIRSAQKADKEGDGAWVLWRALPRTVPYLRPYRPLMTVSIVLMVLATAVGLAEPWPLAIMVDHVLGDRPPGGVLRAVFGEDPSVYTLLVFAAAASFLVVAIGNGLTVWTDYLNTKVEQRMVLDLRSDLFEHCQRLSLTFHDAAFTGQLMSRINNQAAALGAIIMAFPPVGQAALMLLGMLVITFLIDWQVAVVAMVVAPFLFWSFGAYGKRIVPRVRKVQGLEWQSLSIVHEAMAMLRVIVSFGREKHEHTRFRNQGETAVDERVKLTVRQSLYTLAVQGTTAAGTALVLGFGAWRVLQGEITIGELLVLMSYIAAVYQPLEQISSTVASLHEQFVQLNYSLELLDTEPEVKEHPDAIGIGRAQGAVTAEDVSFSYEGRAEAIRDVSFYVEPGERVAIVGPTGAGKTTLVSLLIRFYDPKAGRILIDGTDIRRLKLESLRDQISVVLQEPLLFSGTIAGNIRYGKLEASDDEVIEAAKAANAHDFISSLPDGYDTELGERGAQLSGGERQRICVARAFLKDAPILILDEPTSSIDSKTENVILDALDDLMVDRTSFMVAHRLSTVRHADRILVIKEGRIVESGTHDELVSRRGVYHQLYEAQRRVRRRPGRPRRRELGPGGEGHPRGGDSDLRGSDRRQAPAGASNSPAAAVGAPTPKGGADRDSTAVDPVARDRAATDGTSRDRPAGSSSDGQAALPVPAEDGQAGSPNDRSAGSRSSHNGSPEDLNAHAEADGSVEGGAQSAEPVSSSWAPRIVNVNTDDVEALTYLPGVGRRAAERIVEDRHRNGPFKSLSDLRRVERFDSARVRRLASRARV